MTERNRSDCKYVEIFAHRVGSIGAPSRRTVFIRVMNTELQKFLSVRVGTRTLTFSKKEVQDLRPRYT
jgi:hypothetical protein